MKSIVSGLLLALLLVGLLTFVFNIELVFVVPVSPYIVVVPEQTIDSTITVGMNYTISIYTNYSGNDIWAWQFTLKFNSSILEGLQVSNGDLITTAKHSRATFLPGDFENTLGELSLTCAFVFYTSPPPPITSGPGTLAYVTFRVIGYGSSDITLGQHTALFGPAQPPDYLFACKIIAANQPPSQTSPPYGSDHIGNGLFDNRLREVMAAADIDPDTLNLRSKGKWVTAYIKLPEGYNPEDIEVSSILLNGTIQPVLDHKYDFVTNSSEYLVDRNSDGILERMVKFNRTQVAEHILPKSIMHGNVTLTLAGQLADGALFEGSSVIGVRMPGDVNSDGKVDASDMFDLGKAYGATLDKPTWNPNCDVNEDNRIEALDLFDLIRNYGKTYP